MLAYHLSLGFVSEFLLLSMKSGNWNCVLEIKERIKESPTSLNLGAIFAKCYHVEF